MLKYTDPKDMRDEMLHLTLMDGQVRVLLCRSTEATRAMADIHQPSNVALAAASRIMTGTLMLSTMMKDSQANVTVIFNGDGPAGRVTAVGHGHNVKLTMDHPEMELPLKEDGHLDVGAYIGHSGRMSVIKDLKMKEPYIGQIDIATGEIGEEFARYFTKSEQQPSVVALGALVNDGYCLSSGGVLVQPMPGCSEETLEQLEIRSMLFSSVSREIADMSLDDLYPMWFDGMDPKLLAREDVSWQCDCGKERFARALTTLGPDELKQMIEQDHGAECTCHFCRKQYRFTEEELRQMIEEK